MIPGSKSWSDPWFLLRTLFTLFYSRWNLLKSRQMRNTTGCALAAIPPGDVLDKPSTGFPFAVHTSSYIHHPILIGSYFTRMMDGWFLIPFTWSFILFFILLDAVHRTVFSSQLCCLFYRPPAAAPAAAPILAGLENQNRMILPTMSKWFHMSCVVRTILSLDMIFTLSILGNTINTTSPLLWILLTLS